MKGGDFTLYFLAFDHDAGKLSAEEKSKTRFSREGTLYLPSAVSATDNKLTGVLELTHNHGTESDSSFSGYASGNKDPGRGFGHIVCVPSLQIMHLAHGVATS